MKHFRLTITPWRDPACHRTVELDEQHTLVDLHAVIQHEFELDNDHLWSFFMSGTFFDRSSEFGIGDRSRSPDVDLGELFLSPKMRFAYLFDYGDEHRHEVVVDEVSEADGRIGEPRVIAREGTPPQQYPDHEESDRGEEADPELEPEEAATEFAAEVIAAAERISQWSMALGFEEEIPAEQHQDVLQAVTTVLDTCSDRGALQQLGEAVGDDLDLCIGLVLHPVWKADLSRREALEALQWRLARLPGAQALAPGLPQELVANLRWIANRVDDVPGAPRPFQHVPAALLERTLREVLKTCPNQERLFAIGRAAGTGVAKTLLSEGVAELAPELNDEALTELVRASEAALKRPATSLHVAGVLLERGQVERARAVADRLDPPNMSVEDRLVLARTLELLGDGERAARLLREDLERPWLSEAQRQQTVEHLAGFLSRSGREAEAATVKRTQSAREREENARLSGTIVRGAEKVGRNDPCRCGSGKKAKKCCGAA